MLHIYSAVPASVALFVRSWRFYSKKRSHKSSWQKNSGNSFSVTLPSFVDRRRATWTQSAARAAAAWVRSPSTLSRPPSLLVFFPSRAAVQVRARRRQGEGVQPRLGARPCSAQHRDGERWAQLVADCLCSLSLRAGARSRLSSAEEAAEGRRERSPISGPVEAGLGWPGGSLGGRPEAASGREAWAPFSSCLAGVSWRYQCRRKTGASSSLCPALSSGFVLLCAGLDSSGVKIRRVSGFQWTAQRVWLEYKKRPVCHYRASSLAGWQRLLPVLISALEAEQKLRVVLRI